MKVKLTKSMIDQLAIKGQAYVIWDESIRGFGIKVTPKGKKIFILQQRMKGGKELRLTLGRYGALVLSDAKELAQEHLLDIAKGIDPREQKKQAAAQEKQSMSFREFWEIFDKKYIQENHKIGTIKRNISRIDKYIIPYFGNKEIANITYKDVMQFMDQPSLQKSQIQGARCLALLSVAFKQAELWDYRVRGSNPCAGVPKKATGKVERFLTDAELGKVEEILSTPTLWNGHSLYAIKALHMLLYTGCRKSEVTELQWEDVHIKERYLYFKDSKTGTKTVPLNGKAIELLQSIPKQLGNPYVFCGKNPHTHIQEIRKCWECVRTQAGIPDVRIHDLRHSFASFALKKGVDLYTVSKLLGHKNIATTTRYAHLELGALTEASNKVFG